MTIIRIYKLNALLSRQARSLIQLEAKTPTPNFAISFSRIISKLLLLVALTTIAWIKLVSMSIAASFMYRMGLEIWLTKLSPIGSVMSLIEYIFQCCVYIICQYLINCDRCPSRAQSQITLSGDSIISRLVLVVFAIYLELPYLLY